MSTIEMDPIDALRAFFVLSAAAVCHLCGLHAILPRHNVPSADTPIPQLDILDQHPLCFTLTIPRIRTPSDLDINRRFTK